MPQVVCVPIEITGSKETRSLYENIPYDTATYTVIDEVVGRLLCGSNASKV